MTKKNILVFIILCVSYIADAQVEQIARQLAETEHMKFAEELPSAFERGRSNIFGASQAQRRQFLLEESPQTFSDFLGWDNRRFSTRTLGNVFKALSDQSKPGKSNPSPVSVLFNFPQQPLESVVSVRGVPQNTRARSEVSYVVTTTTDVSVETTRQGVEPGIANNRVIMTWDGKIAMVDGSVDMRNTKPPVLRSISIAAETPPIAIATPQTQLISEEVSSFVAEVTTELQTEVVMQPETEIGVEVETEIETEVEAEVETEVETEVEAEVEAEHETNIYEDEFEFVEDAVSTEIDIVEQSDSQPITLQSDVQEPVVQEPIVQQSIAQQPVTQAVDQPVRQQASQSSGRHFKVQILSNDSFVPISEIPAKFRVENLVIEKYSDNDYKYVIPASSLEEAITIRNQMNELGIQAWIPIYENGERISPALGRPEIIVN